MHFGTNDFEREFFLGYSLFNGSHKDIVDTFNRRSRKINNLIDHYNNMEKNKNYYSDLNDEKDKKIGKLENELTTLRNEKNEISNKLDANLNFNRQSKDNFPKQLKSIKGKMDENSFKMELSNCEELVNLINLITSIEKLEEKAFEELRNIVIENAKKNKSVKHLNIILAGPSGVGKSTLINSIFNLTNENSIETGIGIPCTMGEPKYYESENIPLLRLADSRGIEKSEYRMEELNKSIETFIKTQLDSENPDYFVHCIWYCITGTRLEQSEMDTLKELSRIYKSNSIPIIVVYTRALSQETIDKMDKFIKENFTHDFVPVLAKKDYIVNNIFVEPYGLDKLKEISILRAKEAVKSSCYEFNFLKTKKEVNEIIKKKKENLNVILKSIINEKIEVMSEGKMKEEAYDDLKNLLIYLISNHIYPEERKLISLESEKLIKEFSKNFINKLMPKFDDFFAKYIDKASDDLGQILYNQQSSFYQSYYLQNRKSKDQFKNENKEILIDETKKKALMYFFKNIIKPICTLCVEKFQEISEKIYNQIFEKEEFNNLIVRLIEKDFEEINQNLII